ncbi:MAG: hypothetical protein H6816_11980 [Phycisphaerales bacterium]|nr:hypothetical protein [Phycisphaerales bacterium]
MQKTIVMRSSDFRSMRSLGLNALLLGVGIPLPLTALMLALQPASRSYSAGYIWLGSAALVAALYLIFVLLRPVREWSRVRSLGHCFAWGAMIAAGWFVTLAVTQQFNRRMDTMVIVAGFTVSAVGGAFCLLWWLAQGWHRLVRGRVVCLQDGTLCPNCAYSLIGNESMVCPECGRGFTFDDLATTAEDFRGRTRAAREGEEAADTVPVEAEQAGQFGALLGLGVLYGVAALGLTCAVIVLFQIARMPMRGAMLYLPLFVTGWLVLTIGVIGVRRRMREWKDAVYFGVAYGGTTAAMLGAFLTGEMGRRDWPIAGGCALLAFVASVGLACATSWLGFAAARNRRGSVPPRPGEGSGPRAVRRSGSR